MGLALFTPVYVDVSDFLGLVVWRFHIYLCHQTKDPEPGLTASEKDVVKLALAVEDPGLLRGKQFPGLRF